MIGFLWAFIGAVFGAGGVFTAMRMKIQKTERDVNGLGKKYGRLVALLIRWADTEEKREQLAQTVEPPK
jgi:hypothetical protein